jgi:hypothetical protein
MHCIHERYLQKMPQGFVYDHEYTIRLGGLYLSLYISCPLPSNVVRLSKDKPDQAVYVLCIRGSGLCETCEATPPLTQG